MRFTVSTSALARAVAVVSKGISSSAEEPLLGGILISAEDGSIEMQSTNINVSIRHVMPSNVEEGGRAVVSGRILSGVVKNLPDAVAEFSLDGDVMVVSCEKSVFRLRTLDPAAFPEFPHVDADQSVELPSALLATMADKVHKVTGRDNSRPILAGILLTVADGALRLVATDSYRLAVCETQVGTDLSFEAIVPGAALHQALGLQTMTETVSIGASANQIALTFGSTTYVTRRIEGSFPSYRQLLPTSHSVSVALDAEDTAQALRRAGVVAAGNPSVRMDVAADTMTLSASSPSQGESIEAVRASVDGGPMSIGLNYHYMLDGIEAMSGEVFLEMESAMKPAVFKSHDDISYTYLLMPVRL